MALSVESLNLNGTNGNKDKVTLSSTDCIKLEQQYGAHK